MRKVWLLALCAICICSCQQNGGQSDVAQANLTAASRYFSEVCNGGNLELVDELFTPDYVHTLTDGSTRTGTDTLKQMILIKKTGTTQSEYDRGDGYSRCREGNVSCENGGQ
ncbi:MAG: nuclear transport factor 2 family protein [Bacteroidota bacterium]